MSMGRRGRGEIGRAEGKKYLRRMKLVSRLLGLETSLEGYFLLKNYLTCQFLGSNEFYMYILQYELLTANKFSLLANNYSTIDN